MGGTAVGAALDVRPAFTSREEAARPRLPVEAWVVAAFGAGAVAAVAALAPGCFDWCAPRHVYPQLLAGAALAGALAWLVLPLDAGPRAALGAAGLLAAVGGIVASLAVVFPRPGDWGDPGNLLLLSAGGLAAPLFTMPALSPAASLEFMSRQPKTRAWWLRVGALRIVAFASGAGLVAMASRYPYAIPHLPVWLSGPVALAAAGALAWAAALGAPRVQRTPRSPGRWRRLFAQTPMLRMHTAVEVAVVASAGTWGLLALPWILDTWWSADPAFAVILGVSSGALLYAMGAPRIDAAWGRGRLLACVAFAAAVAPLPLLGVAWDPPANQLFLASLLIGFALASSPQRSALAFDLAGSQGRARFTADLQALKLIAACALLFVALFIASFSPGWTALPAALYGVVALCLFAPTLGSLGVPRA